MWILDQLDRVPYVVRFVGLVLYCGALVVLFCWLGTWAARPKGE